MRPEPLSSLKTVIVSISALSTHAQGGGYVFISSLQSIPYALHFPVPVGKKRLT